MFVEKSLQNAQVGSQAYLVSQKSIIKSRPLIERCYHIWYKNMLADEATVPKQNTGLLLELGAGGSLLKELEPKVITSDVIPGVADMTIDATHLPFEDNSVRAIFMTHCFHHLPSIESFLHEAVRVLVPGGVISMIDCAHTPFAKFFFRHLHPEPYVDTAVEWRSIPYGTELWEANQALSWIVFFRDQQRLQKEFPQLRLQAHNLLPWLSYILSGGVTKKNLVPSFLVKAVQLADHLVSPLDSVFSLHWHLRIRKDF